MIPGWSFPPSAANQACIPPAMRVPLPRTRKTSLNFWLYWRERGMSHGRHTLFAYWRWREEEVYSPSSAIAWMDLFSRRPEGPAALATTRSSTSLLCRNRSLNFPAPSKTSIAIAEELSGGCWRFCRACCSLADMAKTKKGKPAKQKTARAKKSAGEKISARGGIPDPTNPKRVAAILAKLDEAYPNATCELKHENPFQLVFSTILSGQCTDVRVNQVTATLYKKYSDAKAFAHANPAELQQEIRPTGFFRNKTKSVMGASKAIVEDFGGEVPRTMEEMLSLPGVARKTANVVLGTAYGIPSGIVV